MNKSRYWTDQIIEQKKIDIEIKTSRWVHKKVLAILSHNFVTQSMFQDSWKKETNIRSIQKQDNTQIVNN